MKLNKKETLSECWFKVGWTFNQHWLNVSLSPGEMFKQTQDVEQMLF